MTTEDLYNAIQTTFESDTNAFTLEYYAKQLRTSIIRPGYLFKPSFHANSRVAKSVQLRDMQDFSRQFSRKMKILALIQGNLGEAAAKSMVQTVETNLGCGEIEDVS